MAKVGAQRAADLTGRSKSTIQRSMKSGKLSYEVDANGRRIIDVSELERVFGLQQETESQNTKAQHELEKATTMLDMERLKMRIKMLEDQLDSAHTQIEDLKAQRDQWQKQASQVLITSQHSQKQADDLRTEIKERETRAREARERRQKQQLAAQMKTLEAQNENSASASNDLFNFKGLWRKVKGA